MESRPRENLHLELASPFECGSRVNSRDTPKGELSRWLIISWYRSLPCLESKTVLNSGFHGHAMNSGFSRWNLDSGFQSLAGFLELYSGSQSPGSPIPQAKIFLTWSAISPVLEFRNWKKNCLCNRNPWLWNTGILGCPSRIPEYKFHFQWIRNPTVPRIPNPPHFYCSRGRYLMPLSLQSLTKLSLWILILGTQMFSTDFVKMKVLMGSPAL